MIYVGASEILDAFDVNSTLVSPLNRLSMTDNLLTKIPSQISQFVSLNEVYLYNNSISSIPSNSFNFNDKIVSALSLFENRINNIGPGALKGFKK